LATKFPPAIYSAMATQNSAKREIEIKLRVANIGEIMSDLRRLEVGCRGRVLERNTLYDTAKSHFRERGCLLRLRTEVPAPSSLARGGPRRALVTWKAPVRGVGRPRFKQNFEQETEVESIGGWPRLLAALGLRASFRYEKYRTMYRAGTLHIDLDETPVGVFLELEGDPKDIDRMARRLGFRPGDYFRGTYWDLYAAECRSRGRVPRNMLFGA
jgi:adenylate cyclase, class 2